MTTDLPHHVHLYERTKITYVIQNPSDRQIAEVMWQVDVTDQWVYAGPRKMDRVRLLPQSSRSISIEAVPLVLGDIEGPLVRVFERVRAKRQGKSFLDEGSDDDDDDEVEGKGVQELSIWRTSGGTTRSMKVMVLPG